MDAGLRVLWNVSSLLKKTLKKIMSLKLQVPQQFPRSNFAWQPLRQGILINFWRTAESMANIFHKFSMRNDEFQFAKRQ